MSDRTGSAMAQVLQAVRAHNTAGKTDGQLLRQFLAERCEAAFAKLVQRHGPMVLGVCQRILRNVADAEDAFQATFLVLVRRATSLTSRPVLGDWLHGVARRTALNAKRISARRWAKEQAMARPEAQGEDVRHDWLPLLDEELERLPEKYRLPIVLCDLEGRTRAEAARRLDWPEGTVAGRLARGRAILTRQLVRRGLAPSAVSVAAVISQATATACVSATMASSTIRAATLVAAGPTAATGAISANVAALVEGVLKTMLLNKLKIVTVALFLISIVGAGVAAGLHAYQTGAEGPKTAPRGHGQGTPASPPGQTRGEGTAAEPKHDKTSETPTGIGQPKPKPLVPPATQQPDRVQAGDRLTIHATNTLPDGPIAGTFQVEASGKVALGPYYGRVEINGMTLEDAEAVIQNHLAKLVKDPRVSVTRFSPLTGSAASDLERRVQQLEKEVRALRSALEELQKKPAQGSVSPPKGSS